MFVCDTPGNAVQLCTLAREGGQSSPARLLPIVHAAAATIPVIASTTAIQISTMRWACCRAKANSLISMPANCPGVWEYSGSSDQSRVS